MSAARGLDPTGDILALLVQQVEQSRGLLADEVDAAAVVDVVNVVPRDALCPVLLLQEKKKDPFSKTKKFIVL